MRKIAIWNRYLEYSHNKLFEPTAYSIGEDLCYPFIELRKYFLKEGVVLETLDMDRVDNYDYVIFLDVPDQSTCCVPLSEIPKSKRIVILCECSMVFNENRRTDLLEHFGWVLTYDDDLVSQCGYTKNFYPQHLRNMDYSVPFSDKKFAVMVAGNKYSTQKGELYSSRLNTIKYFEDNHPSDFDLYGIGWNKKFIKSNIVHRVLNRLFGNIILASHVSYKGAIEKKNVVLSQYKYCICYENSSDINGYISEKIWDCFFSGTVPVYWGAPNVTDYIPSGCFIDRRNFSSDEELYEYLSLVGEKDYFGYIKNIEDFLNSNGAKLFSTDYYCRQIVDICLFKNTSND